MRAYYFERATTKSTWVRPLPENSTRTPQVAEYTIPSQEKVEEDLDIESTRHALETEGGDRNNVASGQQALGLPQAESVAPHKVKAFASNKLPIF